MSRWGISLAAILVAASLAFGQTLESLPAPRPTSLDAGSISEVPLTSAFADLHHNGRAFFSTEAEYLLWFLKGSRPSFAVSSTGVFGSNTVVANEFGDNNTGAGPFSGGRLTLGYWQFDDNAWAPQQAVRTFGAETRFFFVGSRSTDLSTEGPPNLFRPFFDLNNRTDSAFLVAAPGLATGGVSARGQLGAWGAEANLWKNVYYDKPGTTCVVDFMAGLRYLNANSELDIHSISVYDNTIPAGSAFASFAGNRLQVNDSFVMRNHFFGGQVGVGVKSYLMESFSVEGSLRIAFGTTRQDSSINGSQVRTLANGTTVTSDGGLLALASNSGSRHNFRFSQVPEGQVKGLWSITKQITLSAGFSLIYWNQVLRAANQIDRSIDITQIPNFPGAAGATTTGLGRPAAPFQSSDLWLLGISLGVEYRW